LLWRRSVPETAGEVNITGDGRMVVAAYGDGTIRWHRMDDGRELLAFMPLINKKDWVAWTPEGFYGSTPGARSILKWQVNKDWNTLPEIFPVSKFPKLEREKALQLVLQELETARALGIDDLRQAREEVQRITGAKIPPGSRLFVLTIGIGTYGINASNLKLEYADNDAQDVANALISPRDGLYAQVLPQILIDKNATAKGISEAFGAIRKEMEYGEGNDMAVIMYSGHGAMLGNDGSREFYILPYDVDTRTDLIPDNAISVTELKKRLNSIALKGRVLVLLDACRSGAAMSNGVPMAVNGDFLREALASTNISILTSSSKDEASREDSSWQNGAFTEVLLQALGGQADDDANRVISVAELAKYMDSNLNSLTNGKQTPGMTVRFLSDVLPTSQ
jgi:hypothetical protein